MTSEELTTDERLNLHLAEELLRTGEELASLRALLQGAQARDEHLRKILEYMPQLTHLSTNVSHVASAVQATNGTLNVISSHGINAVDQLTRIANALERLAPPPKET